MIPNLYIENGCFTKHPFINGCLGFQVCIKIKSYQSSSCFFLFVVSAWKTLKNSSVIIFETRTLKKNSVEFIVVWNSSFFFGNENFHKKIGWSNEFKKTVWRVCLEQQKTPFCENLGKFPHLGLKGFGPLGVTGLAVGFTGGGTGGAGVGGGGVVPGTPGGSVGVWWWP